MGKDRRLSLFHEINFFVLLWVSNQMVTHALVHKPTSPVIDITEWGKVQGYQDLFAGRSVSVYLGIPYAKPPTGNLRLAGE